MNETKEKIVLEKSDQAISSMCNAHRTNNSISQPTPNDEQRNEKMKFSAMFCCPFFLSSRWPFVLM